MFPKKPRGIFEGCEVFVSLADDAAIEDYYAKDADPRLKTVAKPENCPKVGDIVCFNDRGLEQAFGSPFGMSFMKRLELRITHVDDVSMTYPEPTFMVEVDDEEINRFLLDHRCFDIVRRA